MKREFTTREKVLLVILAVLIIGLSYYRFLLVPINDGIDQYRADAAAEQDEMLLNTQLLQKQRSMEKELDELFAQGNPAPVPQYDNSGAVLVELNSILGSAVDYTLNFGSTTELEDGGIISRPVNMTFRTKTYNQAKSILEKLHDSDNISVISDLSLANTEDGGQSYVDVTLLITYFERT